MKKIILSLCMAGCTGLVFADASANANQTFINANSYYENPYASLPSGGGTQFMTESATASHNVAQKLFQDGTWNVFTAATANYSGLRNPSNPANKGNWTYGYGATLFGQTGRVGGFSFGGMITADNPFFDSNLNGYRQDQGPWMSTKQITQLNEAYAEYQYSNRVQADAGWISINNSPWLSPAYTLNNMTPGATYQGAIVNVNPGGGWLLTGLAFNAAQMGGNNMAGYTFYNSVNNGPLSSDSNMLSNNTFALGADYKAFNNNFELRAWGYNFDNYGTLLYADTNLNINVTKKLGLDFALQGGTDRGNQFGGSSSNAFTNAGVGTIDSNFAGAQAQVTYDWATLGFAYDNIWGSQNAYGQGAIVDPYTVNINDDPIFANAWDYNMANTGGAGTGYKAYAKFTFLDGNLWLEPVYSSFTNSDPIWNGTQEYDLQFNYSIPQIKGLSIFNILAYEKLPSPNPLADANWGDQVYLTYTY